MKRSSERILTTHVGSLIRPAELLAAGEAARGAVLADIVADVVARQAAAGIDIVNDGEYGKSSWSAYLLDRITGFEVRPDDLRPVVWMGRDMERFPEAILQEMPSAVEGRPVQACTGPIAYTGNGAVERDCDNLKAALAGQNVAEAFLTAVAPASTAYDGIDEHYGNEHDYIFAIAEALGKEYKAIHAA